MKKNSIFSWGSKESRVDVFYDVVLLVPIGKYPVGQTFASAWFSFEYNSLSFYDEDAKLVDAFKVDLSFTEKV